ncbi:UDP-glucose/GDP-mannose dehydrogenase family protein [Candidatus Woesearchaeota archaeon]|nr:UDP-glucose/GDP-mannose dehydrogenase family protein [Candidatus Woesearchaeota archaeon]
MKITVIGTGYVGLVVGTSLANLGNEVLCLDIDDNKIKSLKKGIIPIYEPGLEELFKANVMNKRLAFTTDTKNAVKHGQVIFLAVGTPPGKGHEADLSSVKECAKNIGRYIDSYKVIVNKSTVPVGTAELVRQIIKDNQKSRTSFDVVSNPEFLREGVALKDFENPDRVIIGVESKKAQQIMEHIYRSVARVGRPIMITDIKSAELIKYASNSMLATRISFMNMLSHLCEKVGADIKEVAHGMGLDDRIGPRFLQAGIGYGGSCFPKDIRALIQTMKNHGCSSSLLECVDDINEKQKLSLLAKIEKNLDIKGSTIAVWGLAFKPKTDDIREAPSIVLIKELVKRGARIRAYDPKAVKNAKDALKSQDIEFCAGSNEAIKGADALVVVTEWDEFRNIDLDNLKSVMNKPIVIDGRNIYDSSEMKANGIRYISVGRGEDTYMDT